MKSYKYSTKERAERVAKTLGCVGSHYHNEDGTKKYMPCKSHDIFKSKTKKEKNSKEEEVTELVDIDGTWNSSSIPILDPASSLQGSTTMDKTVGMARNPRDPMMRGWYGYYGEGKLAEEDMADAFGYHDTMFMDYDETVSYFQKKLGLDKDSAIERTIQQGKKPKLHKRVPKKIKNKKNFIDRLILKEKGLDEIEGIGEDIILDKEPKDRGNDLKKSDIPPLLVRNLNQIKKMAKQNGITTQDLIKILKDEQQSL
jgi:hypothetical protein